MGDAQHTCGPFTDPRECPACLANEVDRLERQLAEARDAALEEAARVVEAGLFHDTPTVSTPRDAMKVALREAARRVRALKGTK